MHKQLSKIRKGFSPCYVGALFAFLILILAACGSATTTASSTTPATATPGSTPTVHVGTVTNPDGSITVTHADGSTTTYWPTPTPTQVPTPVPTQAPASPTHTYSGNGSKTTETFSVSDTWTITWTCDATNNYGVDGELSVIVYDSQNNLIDNLLETCKSGVISKGVSEEHQGGDVYLKIDGSVPWTIQIQDNG